MIDIRNRSGAVLLAVPSDTLRCANLSGANLSRADLSGANLSRADLSRADLSRADLSRADLSRANLADADLSGADLIDANLADADLSRADLSRANLAGANLSGANLSGANLGGANLTGADLGGANLSAIEADVRAILTSAPAEVTALRAAVAEGRIDGSMYEGDCVCLVGTIAKARGCGYRDINNVIPDCSRPAERWFLALSPGDTPDRSQVAAITLAWIDRWIEERTPSQ